jgi:predicted amidohydrolase
MEVKVGLAQMNPRLGNVPANLLWLDGADILILTSASPGRGVTTEEKIGSAHWVEHVNQAYASIFTNPVIRCNRTGFEDGVNFWGGLNHV